MADPRWLRVKEIFAAALQCDAADRPALLDDACTGDTGLREEVESLLAASAEAGTFIEQPAALAFGLVSGAGVGGADEPRAGTRSDNDSNIGRVLGPYHIEQRIGHGGMGTVYLARRVDREFERRVAIKMIRRGMDSEEVIRRFRHERQILASLEHPHIGALFDGGTTPEGLPYFVMEYVTGMPIDAYADAHRLSTIDRIRLFLSVLDAVQHAHDRHIVHRDIKPSNVIVTGEGHVKLLDFGIAKILDLGVQSARTLTVLGVPMTPEYASPEQVRGGPVTPATDVYALGLLLYELFTGHRPHRLTTHAPDEMVRVVCEQDPEWPSVVIDRVETATVDGAPPATTTAATVSRTREGSPALLRERLRGALDDIVLKALRKEPGERYSSVAAFADDLRRYLADDPVSASRGALRYRAARLLRRRKALLAAAAIVVAAVGVTALLARGIAQDSQEAATSAAPAPPAVPQRPSLAVLGFRNLSERPADRWLSTALAEMLTTELVGDGQLRVVPAEQVARAEREFARDDPRLPTALGTDYMLLGTFAVTDGSPVRSLRIDVRVVRAAGDPMAVAASGDEASIFSTVAGAGRELRAQLGLKESPRETTNAARAAFPRSLAATKLYAEGMASLRQLDAVAARDLLERAESREPENAMIQTALASAWAALGYDGRAARAAQKAFAAAAALNREDRLNVEGRRYEAERKWPQAIDVYRTLWGFFSDNLEYGLRLASAQTAAGRGMDALATVETMRKVPARSPDPRIDLAAAQAYTSLGDYPHELDALERAIAGAEKAGFRLLVARARLLEGRSYFSQGQPAPAQRSLEAARRVFVAAGDKAGAVSALNSLAVVLDDQRDVASAERTYQEALRMCEDIGDRRGMSSALNNLGVLYKDQRRFAEARQAHERALALRREIGERNWTAVSLSNIGVVLFEQDRLAEARSYYRQSLAIAREIGDKRGQVRALHNLAVVERETGNLQAARASYEESIVTRAEIGDKRGGAMGRVELGMVLLASGELDAARKIEEEALRMAGEAQLRPGEAQALYQLGEIAMVTGDLSAARGYHERALAIRREMGETRTVLESEAALAELAFHEGRIADAGREALRLTRALQPEPASPLRIAMELLLARTRLARGDVDGAVAAVAGARRLAQGTERMDTRRAVAMVQARIDGARGRTAEARSRLNGLRPVFERAGMVLADFERRMLLVQIDRADGRANAAADARALERDAHARRAGLIARRVHQ